MPNFTDSFWSADYAGGLGVLFEKLQQGVTENHQVLTIATMRADAEETFCENLGAIAPSVDRMTKGFARDDGASVRKAYEGVRSEMIGAAQSHSKMASNIRELVVNPFSRWCDAHSTRIQNSQDDLMAKLKAHDRQAELVKKLRSQYFNKCRLVEDAEEENKLAFQEPEKEQQSPKVQPTPKIVLPDSDDELEPVELGDNLYNPEQLKKLLTDMLDHIVLGEAKVPILGTYLNTSTGADIVAYLQKYLKASTVSYGERIGQDLVDNGFLRLVGNVGSTFANSSKMNYQWRPKVFQITGVPEKKKPVTRVSSMGPNIDGVDSPISTVNEMLSGWNPLNNPHANETPAQRLRRESRESDEKYKAGVKRLDQLRCTLEESMMDHLKFLERCETDRLKAIKSVILDFSGAISNVIPAFQSQVDNMMLYQETIQPLGDLRYMLENYRTGAFAPKIVPYENYYGSVDEQTFGIDIEARARADKKRVPIIVTTILTFLDNHYPELDGDEARRSIWLVDVPLAATHHLRNAINNGKAVPREVLERYEIPIVASVLKLYLLELPDSLVSSQVYEVVKTIYAHNPTHKPSPSGESTEEGDSSTRIKVLQSTLGQLRLNNIATLDALTTHFTRLIDLTSADESYISSLATALSPCVLRPRTENSLTLGDRHAYRLIRDLFDFKDAIFGELKRQSSAGTLPSGSGPASGTYTSPPSSTRGTRAISLTDESNRRANMEARAKAISERTRDKSPAPLRHRRDRSTGGFDGAGRFPVVASPTSANHPQSTSVAERIRQANSRHSLEVPSSTDSSPVTTRDDTRQLPEVPSVTTNGITNPIQDIHIPPPSQVVSPQAVDSPSRQGLAQALSSAASTPTTEEPNPTAVADAVEKQNSLKRSSMGSGGKYRPAERTRGLSRNPGSKGSLGGVTEGVADGARGVQLEDRPMDD